MGDYKADYFRAMTPEIAEAAHRAMEFEAQQEVSGPLKLFVWHFVINRHGMVAFAMAHSANEARRLIKANLADWQDKEEIARHLCFNPACFEQPHGGCF
jgi:hypothetical protein